MVSAMLNPLSLVNTTLSIAVSYRAVSGNGYTVIDLLQCIGNDRN